jgi:hypothetical protein
MPFPLSAPAYGLTVQGLSSRWSTFRCPEALQVVKNYVTGHTWITSLQTRDVADESAVLRTCLRRSRVAFACGYRLNLA